MADFNISDFSQKVQNYINENKIDSNNDGKINEGDELKTLLAGCPEANEEIGDMAKLGRPRKIYIDRAGALDAMEKVKRYNNQTPEYRQSVVDKTKADAENAISQLKDTLNENSEKILQKFNEDAIPFTFPLIDGGTMDKAYFENRSSSDIRKFIDELNNTLVDYLCSNENALLSFGGEFNLQRFEYIDYHSALKEMGFSSINDLSKAVAEESFNSYRESHEPQSKTLELFAEKVLQNNHKFVTDQIDYYKQKADSYQASYNESKAVLDSTVAAGITESALKKAEQGGYNADAYYKSVGNAIGLDEPTTTRFAKNLVDADNYATGISKPNANKAKEKTEKRVCNLDGKPTVLIITKENGVIKSAKTLEGTDVDPKMIR